MTSTRSIDLTTARYQPKIYEVPTVKNFQKPTNNGLLCLCWRACQHALVLVTLLLSQSTLARADMPTADMPTMDYSTGGIDGLKDANGNPEAFDSAGAGAQGNTLNSYKTFEAPGNLPVHRIANPTMTQTPSGLPMTRWTILDKTHANQPVSALEPTYIDSLVHQAGGLATQIYDDEGRENRPPFMGFDPQHYIGTGISASQDNSGLTTGHQSSLPSAWGWTMKP
jgi:hypothetical protein